MRLLITLLCITVCFTAVGCNDEATSNSSSTTESSSLIPERKAEAETPQEGAAAILQLLEDEDYNALIKERYSEWQRTLSMPESKSPEVMIEKFSARIAKIRPQLMAYYQLLADSEFTIEKNESPQPGETDKKAVTDVEMDGKKIQVNLYLMESGKWGFHI